ncbi:Poly(ADP-ribose) glycohydrolase 1 [Linum perenne]
MEHREDLNSILPFLPVVLRSSRLFWPSQAVEVIKSLLKGPYISDVTSGESFFNFISELRSSLNLSPETLARYTPEGYALFFDELITRVEAAKWFEEVLPSLATLLLELPSLLESHYQNADDLIDGGLRDVKTGLRLLGPQEDGVVFLSQELIGALLACALFCLFPVDDRRANDLPAINFDHLFASLYSSYRENQENKIKCIIHYFERICSVRPAGFVSFERKVICLEQVSKADFWGKSVIRLCPFEVRQAGLIEDQSDGALEVDFANKRLGGGALRRGCVQEEIRFMINPELIAGILFLTCMEDNEAIEIVGAERFSNYTGYASSFRFSGDHVYQTGFDSCMRRKTRIVAIDALCNPRTRQFEIDNLLRETNKAFCGFSAPLKCVNNGVKGDQCGGDAIVSNVISTNMLQSDELPSTSSDVEMNDADCGSQEVKSLDGKGNRHLDREEMVGIATGNWGCGAFGGDPELKAMIQWLAASQASRPSIFYYTFGIEALQNLDKVVEWIVSHEWVVGELWDMVVEYSSQRYNGRTKLGFLSWLLPSLTAIQKADEEDGTSDVQDMRS